MSPIIVTANQPEARFYRGGAAITAFRSSQPCTSHQPEDWVASTTCCAGCKSSKIGLSRLPDGTFLADAIAAEPNHWLGPKHVARYGVDTKLLVKLLDAGQRLPVHAHPHVSWAKKHLERKHGKAEAWYILTPGTVHLGLMEPVGEQELLQLVTTKRGGELLKRMHKIDVKPHQTVYVPPGLLHAIGEGILLVELQEPEDLSVLVEWAGFAIDGLKDGHLGLGFETALTAVDISVKTREEILSLRTDAETQKSAFHIDSETYFRLQRVKVSGSETCESGFAILIVVGGNLGLWTKVGPELTLMKGSTVVIPFEDGEFTLTGEGELLIARPPL